MPTKFEIRPKGRITLVGIEIILTSILSAIALDKKYGWDTFTTIIVSIIIALFITALFFNWRIFRYLFSVIFSLAWGFIAYMIAENFGAPSITCWITVVLAAVIALSLHIDYFRFEKNPD